MQVLDFFRKREKNFFERRWVRWLRVADRVWTDKRDGRRGLQSQNQSAVQNPEPTSLSYKFEVGD